MKKYLIPFSCICLLAILYLCSTSSKINHKAVLSEKSDTLTNPYSIYDNWKNYFQTTSSPTSAHYKQFANVDELSKADHLTIGETVQTLGYYNKNDGGGAFYQITDKKNGNAYDLIGLKKNLYASLLPSNSTASVKQFGAKGDGINDDSSFLNKAFNSGISSITLEKGDYLCLKPVNISTNNLKISGKQAVLFTTNAYSGGKISEYSGFFNIISSTNIAIDGITLEARETQKVGYFTQFSVQYAENISFEHCNFLIPDTVLSNETNIPNHKTSYFNGDVFTSWKNISIKNCKFVNLSDSEYGGVIDFRDIYKKNCSTALFENNECIYNGHDEMISVVSSTSSSVKDVTIQNNTFSVLPGTVSTPRTMCFTIGYDDNHIVNNITFKNNTIDAYADFSFMTFGTASDVFVSQNKINFHTVTKDAASRLFYCTKPTSKSNINISSNDIVCDTTGTITSFSRGSLYIKNNTITFNLPIVSAIFDQNSQVCNNTITINDSAKILANSVINISNNTITINNTISHIFQFYNTNFSSDYIIKENVITFHSIQNEACTLLMLNGTNLNNHKLIVSNNDFYFSSEDITDKTLYSLSLKESATQTIELINNNFRNFVTTYNYSPSKIQTNIISTNNN